MNYAAIHRMAVREATRVEMNRAIAAVYDATHVAVRDNTIYCYGTLADCESFAAECRKSDRITVREMTDAEKSEQAQHKRRVYRNP